MNSNRATTAASLYRPPISPYLGTITIAPDTDWSNTMPADLVDLAPTEPFHETLQGLATREVHAPEVFQHFFG